MYPAEIEQHDEREALPGLSALAASLGDDEGVDLDGDLVGAYLAGEDLTGIDLSGRDLTGADLAGANLSHCRLNGAILKDAILADAAMQETQLLGADLTGADLTGADAFSAMLGRANLTNAVLFNATLNDATFSHADLTGADLRTANLEGARFQEATLVHTDFSKARMNGADLTRSNVEHAVFRDTDLSRSRVKAVTGYSSADWIGIDILDADFAGAYMVRRTIMDQNYLYEFKHKNRLNSIVYQIWSITSDCGRSFGRWAIWTALIAALFAFGYGFVEIDYGDYETALSPLYYSVVTMTTLGYGDALPASTGGQIMAMVQVVIGYVMLGGVLSIFATKMGRRAE
ncbi:MAG: pentapeptide repeat-containing protein [Acidimicrobiia bacterium]|nr:pentapeptide repeat-containing protein [Acidimicrobiia bacterium]MDJ0922919.1 pentapeptide repeat-containing protein [Acidimicrobiia bacterium]